MFHRQLAFLASAALLVVAAACSQSPGTVEKKSESTTQTPDGTVTVFLSGKKIEVMTGEKKMHSFDLDDKDVVTRVDGAVLVGKRVTITDETGTDKVRHLTVRLAA